MSLWLFCSLVLLSSATVGWSMKVGNNGTMYVFSCNGTAPSIMLYFKDIKYVMANSSVNISMAESGVPVQQLSGCNPVTKSLAGVTSVVASVGLGTAPNNMTINFHFRRTNGKLFTKSESSRNTSFYWELLTIARRTSMEKKPVCFVPQMQDDWIIAPRNFSFSCQPRRSWIPLDVSRSWRTRNDPSVVNGTCGNSSAVRDVLNITGLQVQAFDFSSSRVRFDDSVDCVGYFSGPIIMGFIVGFLLLSVLFITSMIFLGMETPTRFDDPKGKNIHVAN